MMYINERTLNIFRKHNINSGYIPVFNHLFLYTELNILKFEIVLSRKT